MGWAGREPCPLLLQGRKDSCFQETWGSELRGRVEAGGTPSQHGSEGRPSRTLRWPGPGSAQCICFYTRGLASTWKMVAGFHHVETGDLRKVSPPGVLI